MNEHIKSAIFILKNYKEFEISSENDDRTSNEHLSWMLNEIVKNEMSSTKANRWLGYIKGIMVFNETAKFSEIFSSPEKEYENDFSLDKPHIEIAKEYLKNKKTSTTADSLANQCNLSFATITLKNIVSECWSPDYSNQMLGYAQAIMVSLKIIDVDEERERTRSLFNGK